MDAANSAVEGRTWKVRSYSADLHMPWFYGVSGVRHRFHKTRQQTLS